MTQEIGVVDSTNGKLKYDEFPIGKILFMFPYHVSLPPFDIIVVFVQPVSK